MATLIKVPGSDFKAVATGWVPPIPAGLLAQAFLSSDRPTKNWAPGGADFSAVGGRVQSAAYVSLKAGSSGNRHIVTSVADSLAVSMIAVVRSADDETGNATLPVWIGCQGANAGVNVGIGLYVRGAGRDAMTWNYDNNGTVTSDFVQAVDVVDHTKWRFIAGVTDGTNFTLYDKTNSKVTSKTNAKGHVLNTSAQPFLIGNHYASVRQGNSDNALSSVFNRALSATEVEALYQYAKAYLAIRSITI